LVSPASPPRYTPVMVSVVTSLDFYRHGAVQVFEKSAYIYSISFGNALHGRYGFFSFVNMEVV